MSGVFFVSLGNFSGGHVRNIRRFSKIEKEKNNNKIVMRLIMGYRMFEMFQICERLGGIFF